ncbi:hypothetical protein KP509_26G063500 [Ceratopteris richardii]|uniref:RIN4 pathogenic type III effector avirulence factor Avr cleavage site domain-containing protein n=1 Tax=Ceratopteris richardii TaxID=49495 RepID=A0A8T2RLJ6_CERRI|nr:hypothetical protein KP509_26G063500 [Ceratopteris richardii]
MPRPEDSVPKFGHWSRDVAYSFAFDKVRLEREKVSQGLKGEDENASSRRTVPANSSIGNYNEAPRSPAPKKRNVNSDLHEHRTGERFTGSLHKLSKDAEYAAEKEIRDDIWTRNADNNSRRNSKFSRRGVKNEHSNSDSRRHFLHHDSDPGSPSRTPSYGSPLPSGLTSRQHEHYLDRKAHERRERNDIVNPLSSWRDSSEDKPATFNSRNPTASPGMSIKTQKKGNLSVPKFGVWESHDESYTEIFNVVRKERSVKPSVAAILESLSDDDVGSKRAIIHDTSKRQRGWRQYIPCLS